MADDEMKQVEVLFGPYAHSVLTMPAAEADMAVDAHWAMPLRTPPYDHEKEPGHANLTPEERDAAEAAANAWAAGVQGQSEPKKPAPAKPREAPAEEQHEEKRVRTRDLSAEPGRKYPTK